ncbi:MAG: hypothetical protein ENTB_03205 [Enterocloster aldenensis]
MFIVQKNSKNFELPMSREKMLEIKRESGINLFTPTKNARCLRVDFQGVELLEKLPEKVWVQELNMLAYILQQFDQRQAKVFLQSISGISRMYTGEMLNYALCACPEAAGLSSGLEVIPYYTGQNLFDLMEFKNFQDFEKEYSEFQIVKVYMPVEVTFYPADDGDFTKLSEMDAIPYQEAISKMLYDHTQPYNGLSEWNDYPVIWLNNPMYRDGGLLFERPDVEIREGKLWGVIIAGMKHVLPEQKIESLEEYFNGAISDGWGDNLPCVELPEGSLCIHFNECTEVYQQGKGELELTRQEMFRLQSPFQKQRVQNTIGFTADFRSDWEYSRQCPVWMEFSYNRKTVRIPLPAEEKAIKEARVKIRATEDDFVRVCLKTYKVRVVNSLRFSFDEVNLHDFNKLAKEIRLMESDAEEKLWRSLSIQDIPYEKMVLTIAQALEWIRMKNAKETGEIIEAGFDDYNIPE